jgi:[acyl-carrier-protein] S-malonyltransferase
MEKMVLMFPGVGSHHTGMGKFFFDHFQVARDTFTEASDILNINIGQMCFSAEEKSRLDQLENSQLALLTVCAAMYRVFAQEINAEPAYCLGHSLGEYSALCCAGVMKFADALEIVKQRGRLLNSVASTMDGIMAWVINLDYKIVERICRDYSKPGKELYVSAYDSSTQSSISGYKESVFSVGRLLEKEGAIVYPLKLSGPFHCPLMAPAADQIKSVLQEYQYEQPIYPVIANRNVQLYDGRESVVDNLSQQLVQPIRWRDSIEFLIKKGIKTAVEIGPDKVLKHLMKNNTDAIHVYSFENEKDLQRIVNG